MRRSRLPRIDWLAVVAGVPVVAAAVIAGGVTGAGIALRGEDLSDSLTVFGAYLAVLRGGLIGFVVGVAIVGFLTRRRMSRQSAVLSGVLLYSIVWLRPVFWSDEGASLGDGLFWLIPAAGLSFLGAWIGTTLREAGRRSLRGCPEPLR